MDPYSRNQPRKGPGLSPWHIVTIVALIAAIAVGLYFLFERIPEPSRPIAVKPGDQARAIITQIKDQGDLANLDDTFSKAQAFIDSGRLTDAHLLLFYAARKGHPSSARLLGGMYDPITHSSTSSIMDEPDVAQAYKWYKKAIEGGDRTAEIRLEALKVWVERKASEGNEQAKSLLEQWR